MGGRTIHSKVTHFAGGFCGRRVEPGRLCIEKLVISTSGVGFQVPSYLGLTFEFLFGPWGFFDSAISK